MNRELFSFMFCFFSAAASAGLLLPKLIRWSPALHLIDLPNERKLHHSPVPAIGGIVIMLSVFITLIFSPGLRVFFFQHMSLSVSMLVMLVVGVLDDRLDISARLRFCIQLLCAFFIAYSGCRIISLHGFAGINDLPQSVQYLLTILVIVGVTNAFNLIDGIDGLAGGMALVNILTLSVLSISAGQKSWLYLLLPLAGALAVFMKYNWRPAKVFMGDGGSLVLGFVMPVCGISLINASGKTPGIGPSCFLVVVTAYCMIPVMDTLRVFYVRMRQGRSPFSADKNHLHHWLIRHHLLHSQATGKLIRFHIFLIVASAVAARFLHPGLIIGIQIALVMLYTRSLQLFTYFYRWYRFVKRMEAVE